MNYKKTSDGLIMIPREKWGAKKCARVANGRPKDGLGTPGPKGYACGVKEGRETYNGGTSLYGEWAPGIFRELPELAPGFRWEHVTSWGWFVRKIS